MNNFDDPDIKRLADGTIDYGYYAGLGRQARNREAKAFSRRACGLPSSIMKLLRTAVTRALPGAARSIAQHDAAGHLAILDQAQSPG